MKIFKSFVFLGLGALVSFSFTSCSDKDKEPDNFITKTIGFKDVPQYFIASDEYGPNLYYGAQDQITAGYIVKIADDDYAQFPVNYGQTFDSSFKEVWGYSLLNGGFAVSRYHNMEGDTYENQLSVYDTTSPSGGNFVVAFGYADDANYKPVVYSVSNTLDDYAGCARVYITDAKGYIVNNPGTPDSFVTGDKEMAYFKSVKLTNTTYTYLTMKNGNPFSAALNEENKGWFKVEFIAFADNDLKAHPVGKVDAYLANFNPELAGGYIGIIDEWINVDLKSLPEACILVINFAGSDSDDYGLYTPSYCALDQFEISVEK